MKDEKGKSLNESKGKRKKNEGKINNGNSDIFNPQLSARELKKIQYYENMFKKMEQKKEDNANDGDYKYKKKYNKIKRTKKAHKHKKELIEHNEKNSKKNNLKKINSGKEIYSSYKNVNKNESKQKKNNILNSNINHSFSEQCLEGKELMINVKKEKLIKQKLIKSKSIENSEVVTTKKENYINSNLFNSGNIGRINKLYNTKSNSDLNENNYLHIIVNKKENNKIVKIQRNRTNFLLKDYKLIINKEKGYSSDNIISYNNIDEISHEFNKTHLGEEGNVLKAIRSVSFSSNKSEYFFNDSIYNLKSSYDENILENKIIYNDYNSYSFENEKKKILNYFTNNVVKKTNSFNELLKKRRINKNISGMNSSFKIKNNLNSITRNLESSIESNDNLKLYLNDKEITDENANTKSCSIEYFNEEDNESKREINNDFNFKSHNESNNASNSKKMSNVNYCIKKYLDNMKYTNLKKLKKINKENLKIYVRSCVNFLNFSNFDNAILCLLNFQNTVQKKKKK
ncbi:conserved Plasmodium protein, unknown function [Plasmodium gallinaceum]|uniref:Uncharacterized protein n=1 Tax=Plasmodium gallinaceum TaxID=5849 RepID=A0A1J1GX65_PLAGA|nr:conserved Plasmodium protein, unknown function [Plasmodium gallinaceum]CRG97145.1 conserved Plasmodium protein, unknown function [Plasmodium gallinaceum]